LSADARHFHVVPLDSQRDIAPVTFTAELNSVKIISHALLSNFEFDQSFWVPSTMSLMPVSVQVDSGEVRCGITSVTTEVVLMPYLSLFQIPPKQPLTAHH